MQAFSLPWGESADYTILIKQEELLKSTESDF